MGLQLRFARNQLTFSDFQLCFAVGNRAFCPAELLTGGFQLQLILLRLAQNLLAGGIQLLLPVRLEPLVAFVRLLLGKILQPALHLVNLRIILLRIDGSSFGVEPDKDFGIIIAVKGIL